MTGKEIVKRWTGSESYNGFYSDLVSMIDDALAAQRDRCAQIVWEYRGCCVTDTSARALMVEVRRE